MNFAAAIYGLVLVGGLVLALVLGGYSTLRWPAARAERRERAEHDDTEQQVGKPL